MISKTQIERSGSQMMVTNLDGQVECKVKAWRQHCKETFIVDVINRKSEFTVSFPGRAGSQNYLIGNTPVSLNRAQILDLIHTKDNFRWANHPGMDEMVAELIFRSIRTILNNK